MGNFELFAKPWWVNLLIFIPFLTFYFWRNKLNISKKTLFTAGIFGLAFGFVEASVVVYLRGAAGLLPVASFSAHQSQILGQLPHLFFTVEFFREAATIVMLASIALLSAKFWRDRLAVFLWTFAFWDLFYYVALWATIRWPQSLTTSDVLFLIPSAWSSQVWFPILISGFTALSVAFGRKK